MDDCLSEIDPVRVLVDEAIRVLIIDDPMWSLSRKEHKAEKIEELKESSLRRVTHKGYHIYSMIVNHRVLLCHAPLSSRCNARYNPFQD